MMDHGLVARFPILSAIEFLKFLKETAKKDQILNVITLYSEWTTMIIVRNNEI